MEQYLQILAESLKKKSSILTQLAKESEQQASIVQQETVDWEKFDASVEKKGTLIDELNKLDDGFEALYQRIKEGLQKDRMKYQGRIQELQKLIAEVTEKSSALMAAEERNKALVAGRFASERRKMGQQRKNSKIVSNYYAAMNKINYIDPQLMDKKK